MACGGCSARRSRIRKAAGDLAGAVLPNVGSAPAAGIPRSTGANARRLMGELVKGAAEMAGLKEKTAEQENARDGDAS